MFSQKLQKRKTYFRDVDTETMFEFAVGGKCGDTHFRALPSPCCRR